MDTIFSAIYPISFRPLVFIVLLLYLFYNLPLRSDRAIAKPCVISEDVQKSISTKTTAGAEARAGLSPTRTQSLRIIAMLAP